jgi:hypothetical protein
MFISTPALPMIRRMTMKLITFSPATSILYHRSYPRYPRAPSSTDHCLVIVDITVPFHRLLTGKRKNWHLICKSSLCNPLENANPMQLRNLTTPCHRPTLTGKQLLVPEYVQTQVMKQLSEAKQSTTRFPSLLLTPG